MKIGLVDVDGHNYPNLALMKLSAYHKQEGNQCEMASMFSHYDVLYKSKVFTFSEDDLTIYNADEVKTGGTGYGDYSWLPDCIEHIYPDYSLYSVKDAYGFTTRGCHRKCKFCVVPQKEGYIRGHAEIKEFWHSQENVILMDNNIVACNHGIEQIEWSIGKCKIDCNQGLDARIIAQSEYLQKLLGRVNWINYIRLACDHKSQIDPVKKSIDGIFKYADKRLPIFVYTLITDDYEDSLERLQWVKSLGRPIDPFAQPYRPLDKASYTIPRWQRQMARWANHKAIFRSIDFDEYGQIKDKEDAAQGSLF